MYGPSLYMYTTKMPYRNKDDGKGLTPILRSLLCNALMLYCNALMLYCHHEVFLVPDTCMFLQFVQKAIHKVFVHDI